MLAIRDVPISPLEVRGIVARALVVVVLLPDHAPEELTALAQLALRVGPAAEEEEALVVVVEEVEVEVGVVVEGVVEGVDAEAEADEIRKALAYLAGEMEFWVVVLHMGGLLDGLHTIWRPSTLTDWGLSVGQPDDRSLWCLC